MQHYKFIHGIIANKELYGNQVVPVKDIACDQCDLVFKYKKNLNVHKKKHSQESQSNFKCDECGKIFQLKNSLTRQAKVNITSE